jgi:predicted permease
VIPSWLGTRADIATGLRAQGDRGTAARASHRTRDLFVVAEIALSLVLLTGATLLLKALGEIRQTPVAAQPQQLLAVELSLPWNSDDRMVRDFYGRVLAEMKTIPGANSVGFTNALPYAGAFSNGEAIVDGNPSSTARTQLLFHAISADYLQTMGAKLLSGRWLTEADREQRPLVGLINETAARRIFGGQSPVGRRIATPERKEQPIEIVGVVSDLPREMGARPFVPELYQPYRQTYWPMASFVLRSSNGAASLVGGAREAVRRVDPNHVIEKIHTMDEHVSNTTAAPRYQFGLVAVFAGMALLLAALGVYGIMAQRVADRRREAGIRAALGASPTQVLHWTMSRGWRLLGIGLLLGAAGSAAVMRLLDSMLFGLDPFDPIAWAGAASLLALAAAGANAIAGRRILQADPAQVLKAE